MTFPVLGTSLTETDLYVVHEALPTPFDNGPARIGELFAILHGPTSAPRVPCQSFEFSALFATQPRQIGNKFSSREQRSFSTFNTEAERKAAASCPSPWW